MKISKKILLITLILFLSFAAGCSKNLMGPNGLEPESNDSGMASDLEAVDENLRAGDSSSAPDWAVDSGRSFGSAEQGVPGNGATGSFSAEPFDGGSGLAKAESLSEGDGSSAPDWTVDSGRSFGSAEQGVPGNGSTGSFAAGPFSGGSELFKAESLSGGDGSSAPDWTVDPGRSFGSAEQGMPGNGAAGSFSAEPFLTEKGDDMVIPLPRDEEVRRLLPYDSIDRLTDIHFAFDRFDLDDTSRSILQANAAYLKTHPASKVEIQGHCDERGSNSYNISLGERRARSTQSYLISLGVDRNQIRTLSYGEERPFCFESNEACWYKNRRAHFLVAEPAGSLAHP